MPWVKEDMCTGCGTCEEECPAGAIALTDGIASIDDDKCIRCAICHEACPEDAVRHDGERVPMEVNANLAWVERMMDHEYYANDSQKKKELLGRLQKFFNKERKVVDLTIERIVQLQNSL